ncbi:MAG: outer membrane beta-barrel protein [Flavobacteriales bacterium]|nr:outer membrane beta-barrel protein [Flavobacteriales bacterium]
MNKQILTVAVALFALSASAQFQVNPQVGVNFQQLTSPDAGVEYKANLGWQLGADLRFGDRLFFQPGAFFGRSVTAIKSVNSDTLVYEDDLVRTNLRLKAMVGYRLIDTYQFDLRFAMGPTYDVLLSVDDRDDRIGYDEGDFNKGSMNIDAALGFDMGLISVEPSVSFGLSRVFSDNPAVKDIGSKYLVYGLTVGINLGNDDK